MLEGFKRWLTRKPARDTQPGASAELKSFNDWSRRAQVQRQYEAAPPNIEQDKLRERLAKLSGGTAILYAGGVTPVEQKRTIQLIEDSLNAVRAASEEGVVAGGGSALAQIAPRLDKVAASVDGDIAEGVRQGKSLALAQSSPVDGFGASFTGTNS